ncbi:hypothetical protein GCM10027288_22850 [Bordetella tumbae]
MRISSGLACHDAGDYQTVIPHALASLRRGIEIYQDTVQSGAMWRRVVWRDTPVGYTDLEPLSVKIRGINGMWRKGAFERPTRNCDGGLAQLGDAIEVYSE